MVSPESVLRDFMVEMNSWERRCALRTEQCTSGALDFSEALDVGTAEYMDIYRRYCSQSKGSPRDFHYTQPPDYDPEHEVILGMRRTSADRVEICTQQNYSHRKRHIYRLVLEDDAWRLAEKFIELDDGRLLEASL